MFLIALSLDPSAPPRSLLRGSPCSAYEKVDVVLGGAKYVVVLREEGTVIAASKALSKKVSNAGIAAHNLDAGRLSQHPRCFVPSTISATGTAT